MKKSRILTFIVTFIFVLTSMFACFPGISASASTIIISDDDYANAENILKLICPNLPLAEGEVTTRAEFVATVSMAMNLSDVKAANTGYADVPLTHPYAAHIAYAANLGLISNVDLFYPDSPITYAQAIKIVMTAIGYGTKAQYTGGYPTGYLKAANEADVGKSLAATNDSYLTHADSIKLVFDAVCTDMMEVTTYGDSFDYTVTEGKNILSTYHKIFIAQGVVEANENTGLYSKTAGAGQDTIKINGKSFLAKDCADFIGRKVKVFYKDDYKNTAIAVYEVENNVLTFNEDDALNISGLTLNVQDYDLNDDADYALDGAYSVIFNGHHYAGSESNYNTAINPVSGTVSVIDNDDDGTYEVIVVKSIEYGVIGNINVFEEKIYDRYKGYQSNTNNGLISLGGVKYSVVSQTGEALTLDDLEAGSAVGYVESKDSKLVQIILYKERIGGTFNSIIDGKLCLTDKEFTLSSYYTTNIKALASLKFGTEVILHLGENNTVIYVEEFASSLKYGVLISADKEQKLDGKTMVMLFNADGQMCTYTLADNFKIDGTKPANALSELRVISGEDDIDPINDPGTKNPLIKRVVKYGLNANGELLKLYQTVTNSLGVGAVTTHTENESGPVLFSDNTITGRTTKTLFYKGGVFYPLFHMAAGCSIIQVPKSDDNKFDEKYYATHTTSTLETYTDSTSENVECYGYDVDMDGAGFVLWTIDLAGAGSIGEEAGSGIVESVTKGLNKMGEEAWMLKMYQGGSWEKYYATATTENDVKNLKPGDIIRVATNFEDEITAIETHFHANDKTFTTGISGAGDIADNGYQGKTAGYVGGYVYTCSGSKATIVRHKTKEQIANVIAGTASLVSEDVYPVSLTAKSTVFVKFINDRATGKTVSAEVYKESDMSSVETIYSAGTDADYVVSRERFHSVSLNVVYVNEYVN